MKVQKAWLDLERYSSAVTASRAKTTSVMACLYAIPHPDDADIDAAMAGNICRCGTYVRIRQAIKHAAAET